jgi:hypothetical protein
MEWPGVKYRANAANDRDKQIYTGQHLCSDFDFLGKTIIDKLSTFY